MNEEKMKILQQQWRNEISKFKYHWFISVSSTNSTKVDFEKLVWLKNEIKNLTPKTISYGYINLVRNKRYQTHGHILSSSSSYKKNIPLTNIDIDFIVDELAKKYKVSNPDYYQDNFKNEHVLFNINGLNVDICNIKPTNDQANMIDYFTSLENSDQIESCFNIIPIQPNRMKRILAKEIES